MISAVIWIIERDIVLERLLSSNSMRTSHNIQLMTCAIQNKQLNFSPLRIVDAFTAPTALNVAISIRLHQMTLEKNFHDCRSSGLNKQAAKVRSVIGKHSS